MGVVYKREGNNPEHAWNEMIRRVNELADECGFDGLEEVGPMHRWSKSDIREVQDKLKEICDENEFDPIPEKWKQSIIDEFMDALERGCCECSREPVLLDPAAFPYTSSTNDISGGTDGLVFLAELDLFGVPFTETIDYSPQLNAINAETQALRDQLEEIEDEIETLQENISDGGTPEQILALQTQINELREMQSDLQAELKVKNKAKGKHFWAITRQFDTGVGQGTRFGVINKDGTLRNPEPLGPAQPGAAGLLGVNGGAVYQFVALCQDPETLIASGAATFFSGESPENFGALLPDWRELTSEEP